MINLNHTTMARHNSVVLTAGPLVACADIGLDSESPDKLADMYWLIIESLALVVGAHLNLSDRAVADRVEEIARRIAAGEHLEGRINI